MDKNTVIGLVLIFAIIVGFSWLNRPNEEQIEAQKRYRDSIQKVELAKAQQIIGILLVFVIIFILSFFVRGIATTKSKYRYFSKC